MAAVIRIKRRINEDPAEALRLSCKRQKCLESESAKDDAGTEKKDESVQDLKLAFAGTISSKNDPVAHHIKAAIKRTKLHKEMHPHSAEVRHVSRQKVSTKLREQTSDSSRTNRYRVTWSRRALNLDLLDSNVSAEDEASNQQNDAEARLSDNSSLPLSASKSSVRSEDKENDKLSLVSQSSGQLNTPCSEVLASRSAHNSSDSSVISKEPFTPDKPPEVLRDAKTKASDSDKTSSVLREDKMFCIFDVENEEEDDVLHGLSTVNKCASEITVNGQPMVSKTLTAPLAESEYVYDLYYTHSNLNDLDLEAVMTVQSICNRFVNEANDDDDGDLVYDDDDDSNDEGNWRNDYPDEDPHFFENEDDDDGHHYFAEDMIDTNVLDDGDMLAEWLGARCKVEADGDESEDDYGEKSDDEFDGMY